MAGRDAVVGGSLALVIIVSVDLVPIVVCARCGVTVGVVGDDGWW